MRPVRAHLGALLVLLLLIGAGVTRWLVPASETWFHMAGAVLSAVPIALWLHQYAYNRIDRWRLYVNRLRLLTTNAEAAWGITADYTTADPIGAMQRATLVVDTFDSAVVSSISRQGSIAVWNIDGATLKLSIERHPDPIDGDAPVVRVELPMIRRAFRGLERAIDRQVAPLLERLDDAVAPSSRKIVARIHFPQGNPYFGMFVANVERDSVARFNVEFFTQEAAERDLVRVLKDRIELTTESLRAAEKLSRRHLGLRPV